MEEAVCEAALLVLGAIVDVDVGGAVVVVIVTFTSLLQPNHPGVAQLVVVYVVVITGMVELVVMVSSKHPHHPGVLQVVVRVRVEVLVIV